MSFILDALKKSESDRQRQNGPALFEVKVAPRRVGLPLWAVAIGALLGINLIIVMWMLLRHPAHPRAPRRGRARPRAGSGGPGQRAAPQPAPVPARAVRRRRTPARRRRACRRRWPMRPRPRACRRHRPPPAPRTRIRRTSHRPPSLRPCWAATCKRGTAEGVPLYQDAAVVPGTHIPPLRLDLHVYAARPEERFVMINMKKLREGDTLPEGVRVESITPEGAVLSYSGSRFLLPSQ